MTIPTPDESGERDLRDTIKWVADLMDAADGALDHDTYDQMREFGGELDPPDDAEIFIRVGTRTKLNALFNAIIELRRIESRRSTDTRTEVLEGENKRLREALEKIRRLPSRPFPDPGAHSWRAWGMAVRGAWEDIQSVARLALWPDALKANTPPPRDGE